MAAPTNHGDAAFAEGDRVSKRLSLFQSWKWTQAAELFTTATNFFRLGSEWTKVAEAQIRCAECYQRLKQPEQAASCYVAAAQSLKQCDDPNSALHLKTAAEIYKNLGQLLLSAKLMREAAEIHEKLLELDDALICYESAARSFDLSQSKSYSVACYIKVADIASQTHEFEKASFVYQKIAVDAKSNQVLRWKVTDFLFRAGLVLLCSRNMKIAKRSLSVYKEIDRSFHKTKEYRLLSDFISAHRRFEFAEAAGTIEKYCENTELDPWKASIFLYILSLINHDS